MPYTPIGSKRGSVRYFRYVRAAEAKTRVRSDYPKSLAGPAFDAHVQGLLAQATGEPGPLSDDIIGRCVAGITVLGKTARLTLTPEGQARTGLDQAMINLTPFIHTRRRRELMAAGRANRPIRAEARATIIETVAQARHWLDELAAGSVISIDELAKRERQKPRQITATLSCAFVAPDIVAGAIEGTLPDGVGIARMKDMPLEWDRQRRSLRLPETRTN